MKDNEEFLRTDPDAHRKVFFFFVINWIVPIICVLVGLFITTQKFAKMMNYDINVIGRPLFVLKNNYAVFNPLMFVLGMIKYAFDDVYSYYFFQAVPPLFCAISIAVVLFAVTSLCLTAHQKTNIFMELQDGQIGKIWKDMDCFKDMA